MVSRAEVMANASTLWPASLHRVIANWSVFPRQSDTYRLQGADLCGINCNDSSYQSLVGADLQFAV